jgi:hypothetical protein
MKKDVSLIGLVTMLAVLTKNCKLSSDAVNKIMSNNSLFESVVKQELNVSDMDLFRLFILCEKWQDGNNLDIFNFRLGE